MPHNFLLSRGAHPDIGHLHPLVAHSLAQAVSDHEATTGQAVDISTLHQNLPLQHQLRANMTQAPHHDPATNMVYHPQVLR